MDKLLAALEKKKAKPMDELAKKAKLSVIQDMKKAAEQKMGDKLGKLKKVSVMSDSDEGLEKGLEKAKQILGHESEEKEEEALHEAAESPEHEAAESKEEEKAEHASEEGIHKDQDMDEALIERKFKELMEKRARQKGKL